MISIISGTFNIIFQDAFRHIDYGDSYSSDQAGSPGRGPHCSLLTSGRSNPNSWFIFARTKGELEKSVKGLEFSYTSIFRPGILERGDLTRFEEKIVSKW